MKENKTLSIQDLPDELYEIIFNYIPQPDFLRIKKVNRFFSEQIDRRFSLSSKHLHSEVVEGKFLMTMYRLTTKNRANQLKNYVGIYVFNTELEVLSHSVFLDVENALMTLKWNTRFCLAGESFILGGVDSYVEDKKSYAPGTVMIDLKQNFFTVAQPVLGCRIKQIQATLIDENNVEMALLLDIEGEDDKVGIFHLNLKPGQAPFTLKNEIAFDNWALPTGKKENIYSLKIASDYILACSRWPTPYSHQIVYLKNRQENHTRVYLCNLIPSLLSIAKEKFLVIQQSPHKKAYISEFNILDFSGVSIKNPDTLAQRFFEGMSMSFKLHTNGGTYILDIQGFQNSALILYENQLTLLNPETQAESLLYGLNEHCRFIKRLYVQPDDGHCMMLIEEDAKVYFCLVFDLKSKQEVKRIHLDEKPNNHYCFMYNPTKKILYRISSEGSVNPPSNKIEEETVVETEKNGFNVSPI